MFRFEENKCYQMPVHFGGEDYPGPSATVSHRDVTCLSFSYQTDRSRLADFLPEGFDLLEPELIISYVTYPGEEWLPGGYHNVISIHIPVRFDGKRDFLEGEYVLAIWENLTEAIPGGREVFGMPKIFADISNMHCSHLKYHVSARIREQEFLRLHLSDTARVSGKPLEEMKGFQKKMKTIGWRYIPKVHGRGAELSQYILYPVGFTLADAWAGNGTVTWNVPTKDVSPYHASILQIFADLPVISMKSAFLSKGVLEHNPGKGRVIE